MVFDNKFLVPKVVKQSYFLVLYKVPILKEEENSFFVILSFTSHFSYQLELNKK